MRHKWADLIHLWAEGAEIQCNINEHSGDFGWLDDDEPCWHGKNLKFRVKPKEPDWWENIPEHGILAKGEKFGSYAVLTCKPVIPSEWTPLTNEEIMRFFR